MAATRWWLGFSDRTFCEFFGRYAATQIVEKVALLAGEAEGMVEAARAAVEEVHAVMVMW